MRWLIALTVALFGASASMGGEPAHTRFLLPLYTRPVPGAFGSLWEVDTWYHYTGRAAVTVIPSPFVCAVLCPGPGGIVGPRDAPHPLVAVFPRESGVLIHLPREHVSAFTFESRVRDLSRDSESAGTEVPVVPESAMISAPLYLMNVPVGPNMRWTLRIYALPEAPSPVVDVRYFRMLTRTTVGGGVAGDPVLLRSERLPLRTYPATDGFLLHPSFASVASFDTLPDLAGETSIWIEVVPVTASLRLWAMVSVTNTSTQQVTLVTPARQ